MTVTTLEHVELTVEDFALPCEVDDCDSAAVYAIRTCCCPRIWCECCTTGFTAFIARNIEEAAELAEELQR